MNTNTYYLQLRPGDRVIVPKSAANLVKHHGIYIGYAAHGQHWFLENHHTSGVRYITSEYFLLDTSADKVRIQPFTGTEWERQAAMKLAKSMLGRPYDLFMYNCEHYCNEVQHGKPESKQVAGGLLAVGVIALLFGGLAVSK